MGRTAYEMENMNWDAIFEDAKNEPSIFVSLYLSRFYGAKRTELAGLTKKTLLAENEPFQITSKGYIDISNDTALYEQVIRLPEGYLFENKGDYLVARSIDDRLASFLKKYGYPTFTFTDARTLFLFEHLKTAGELRTVGAGYGDSSTFNEKNAKILGITIEDYARYAKNKPSTQPEYLLHEEFEKLTSYIDIISSMGFNREISVTKLHECNELLATFIQKSKKSEEDS